MIYLDHAATTPLLPKALEAMLPYMTENYANASGIYSPAASAKKAIEQARGQIAALIGSKPAEIFFTAGGSESDNWALIASAFMNRDHAHHMITTNIEHHAILHTAEYLEKLGIEVTYVPVDEDGLVNPKDIEAAIRLDTFLISVMYANNEIGVIQPIAEIAEIAKQHKILFHTDAVQACGHIAIDVEKEKIDMLSASAHKFGGPKGVGFLYIRGGVRIGSLIHGGAQERGRRAGTYNTAGIVGMGVAAEEAQKRISSQASESKPGITQLRDYLIQRVLTEIPYTRLNGHASKRLPNNTNFSFEFVEGESILIMLDMNGICGSSGSACTSGALDPSHVLLALGLKHEMAHGSLRLTLGLENTKEEIDTVVEKLKEIITRLRSMSPLYEDFMKK